MTPEPATGITTSEVLIKLLEQGASHSKTLENVVSSLEKFDGKHDQLIKQVTEMQTLDGVQSEKIASLERRADAAGKERDGLKSFMYKMIGGFAGLQGVLIVYEVLRAFGVLQ